MKEGKRKNVDQLTDIKEKEAFYVDGKRQKENIEGEKNLLGSPSSLTPPNSPSGNVPLAQGPSCQKMSADRKIFVCLGFIVALGNFSLIWRCYLTSKGLQILF